MTSAPANPAGSRRAFLVLLAIFVLPVATAYLVYFQFPQLRPTATTNYGRLLTPARPLPPLQLRDAAGKPAAEALFKGKWSLLYLAPAACAERCRAQVFLSRQVRTALDRNARRLQRVYIAPDAAALEAARGLFGVEHPDLLLLADTGAAGSRAADFFQAAPADALLMVDPLGNWFMAYPPRTEPAADFKGILKDLKKLLNQSQVD